MKLSNLAFLKGQKVKLLEKSVLLKAGYPQNDDHKDFINCLAGKEVTIDDIFKEHGIYTCVEYPGFAIYHVFIDKIEYNDGLAYSSIANNLNTSRETIRRTLNRAINKIKSVIEDKDIVNDFVESL